MEYRTLFLIGLIWLLASICFRESASANTNLGIFKLERALVQLAIDQPD